MGAFYSAHQTSHMPAFSFKINGGKP